MVVYLFTDRFACDMGHRNTNVLFFQVKSPLHECADVAFKCSPHVYTVEPPNNGHIGDEHFVHCSEVVPFSEVEMYGQYIGRG